MKKSQKVFCIGFNKTGTSSIHSLFHQLGLKSLHNTIWPEISNYATDATFSAFFEENDCFSDGEMPDIVRLDKAFPNAKYVLNVRELHSWLKSRIKWVYRKYPQKTKGPMAQEYFVDSKIAIGMWIDRRRYFHNWIIEYFKDRPNSLLIVNVCSELNWEQKVTDFLEIDKQIKGIHSNKMKLAKMSKEKVEFLEKRIEEMNQLLTKKGIEESHWNNETIVPNFKIASKDLKEIRQDLSRLVGKWELHYQEQN